MEGACKNSTTEAGSCLVATAEKSNVKLLSLLFGCNNADSKENAYSFVDTTRMFEHVFNNYKTVTSRLIRKEFQEFLKPYYWKPYFWSDSYFICTVSDRTEEMIRSYIRNQGAANPS